MQAGGGLSEDQSVASAVVQADDLAGAVQVQVERLYEGEVFLTALSEQRKKKGGKLSLVCFGFAPVWAVSSSRGVPSRGPVEAAPLRHGS